MDLVRTDSSVRWNNEAVAPPKPSDANLKGCKSYVQHLQRSRAWKPRRCGFRSGLVDGHISSLPLYHWWTSEGQEVGRKFCMLVLFGLRYCSLLTKVTRKGRERRFALFKILVWFTKWSLKLQGTLFLQRMNISMRFLYEISSAQTTSMISLMTSSSWAKVHSGWVIWTIRTPAETAGRW